MELRAASWITTRGCARAGNAGATNALREAEQQLKLRSERVTALETELAVAQRTAAELRVQLDQETAQGARHEKALRESEQKLADKSERVTGLEKDLANEQRAVAEQRALLDQERLQGAQRERELRERGLAFEQQLSDLRQRTGRARRQRSASRPKTCSTCAAATSDHSRRCRPGTDSVAWSSAQLDEQDARLAQANAQHAEQLAATEARSSLSQSEAEARAAKLLADAEAQRALQSELDAARTLPKRATRCKPRQKRACEIDIGGRDAQPIAGRSGRAYGCRQPRGSTGRVAARGRGRA